MRRTGFSVIIGSWKIIAIAVAAHVRACCSGVSVAQLDAVEHDAAGDDPARRIDEAHQRVAGHRLARAGFADQAQHLAAADGERHVVDRLDHAGLGEEMRAQALRRRGRAAAIVASRSSAKPRIQHVAQLVGDEVDADDRQQQRDAREEADPVLAGQQVLVAVGDQQAQRRLGDRQAEARGTTASLRARSPRPPARWRRRSSAAGSWAAGGGTRCATATARGSAPPRCIPCASRPAPRCARCARSRPTAR